MHIAQKIKGTLSVAFNGLSGKEGWRVAVEGWAALGWAALGCAAFTGGLSIAATFLGAAELFLAAAVGGDAYDHAKKHDAKGPKP